MLSIDKAKEIGKENSIDVAFVISSLTGIFPAFYNFSPQNYSFINTNASALTLYFGSVFYYTMKNVDWQQPVITINPGSGYFIEYNFTVRLTEITYFNGFGTLRVSEFL